MSTENEKIINIQFDNAPQTIDIDFDNNTKVLDADLGNVQMITVGNVSVSLEETDEGVMITAWDAQGEETALVRNGKDGISPVVSVQDITGGHRVTITDKDGEKTFDVMDGKDGTGGGAQVQADWAVNDPESPAYVQNRTHYEIPAFEPITWDGDMDGRFALDLSMLGYEQGMYFVKVSDYVPTINDIVGSKVTLSNGTVETVTAEGIDQTSFPGAYLATDELIVCHDQATLNATLGLPEGYVTNGTYFLRDNTLHVTSLTAGRTIVKKIDPKFLPEVETPDIVIPEGVQSDWGQNDESKPDFVKNRTHWVERAYEPIVWDGSTEGRDSVDLSAFEIGVVHKISNAMPTLDQLNGSTTTQTKIAEFGRIVTNTGPLQDIMDVSQIVSGVPEGFATFADCGSWIDLGDGSDERFTLGFLVVFYVAGDFTSSLGIQIPSTGTYAIQLDGPWSLEVKKETYHTLDKNYIPVQELSYWELGGEKPFWRGENEGTIAFNSSHNRTGRANSTAFGELTVATKENSFVCGIYNRVDYESKYLFITGNGTSDTERSNAYTLDERGQPWYQGRPQFGGKAQDDGAQTVMGNGDKEIVLASPSGKLFGITVTDDGVLTVAAKE